MQQQKPQPSLLQALDAGLVVQLQALTAQLTAAATANSLNPLEQRVSSFNKVTAGRGLPGVVLVPRCRNDLHEGRCAVLYCTVL